MKAFLVKGHFKMGDELQEFTKELATTDKDSAKELIFSVFGSKHRASRKQIFIKSITEIKPDQLESVAVKFQVEHS